MNKSEALKAAIDGEKIEAPDNGKDNYIIFDGSDFAYRCGSLVDLSIHPTMGWKIYKKKKKVKLYQYANGKGFCTNNFYSEDKRLRWDGISLSSVGIRPIDHDRWIKTNCFIEVETDEDV